MTGPYQSQSYFIICPYKNQQLRPKIITESFAIASIFFFVSHIQEPAWAAAWHTDFCPLWLVETNPFYLF